MGCTAATSTIAEHILITFRRVLGKVDASAKHSSHVGKAFVESFEGKTASGVKIGGRDGPKIDGQLINEFSSPFLRNRYLYVQSLRRMVIHGRASARWRFHGFPRPLPAVDGSISRGAECCGPSGSSICYICNRTQSIGQAGFSAEHPT